MSLPSEVISLTLGDLLRERIILTGARILHLPVACIQGTANAGDAAGWFMSPQTRPVMGAVMLDGDRRWIATPGIKSDLLKDDRTTACTLSFSYIGVLNSPSSFARKP